MTTVTTPGGEVLVVHTSSNTHIDTYQKIEASLFECSQKGEGWKDGDIVEALQLLAEKPAKNILVRTVELICKYARNFPLHQATACAAIIELCKNEEPMYRQIILRNIVDVVRGPGTTCVAPLVGKVVVELFKLKKLCSKQPEQLQSVGHVDSTLAKLVAIAPAAVVHQCVEAICTSEAEEEREWREEMQEFVLKEVLGKQKAIPVDQEMQIKDDIFKLLQEVSTENDLKALIPGLTCLRIFQPSNKELGPQGVVDILQSLVNVTADVDVTALWEVERALSIIEQTIPLLEKHSGLVDKAFTRYILDKILAKPEVVEKLGGALHLRVLQRLCELAPFCPPEVADSGLVTLYPLVLQHVVERPADESATPNLDFPYVEGYLFAMLVLGRKNPEAFHRVTGIWVSEDLKAAQKAAGEKKANIEAGATLRNRLLYLTESTTKIMLQLEHSAKQLQAKGTDDPRKAEKIEQINDALAILKTVLALSKPMKEAYPFFTQMPTLSWRGTKDLKRRRDDSAGPAVRKAEVEPAVKKAAAGGAKAARPVGQYIPPNRQTDRQAKEVELPQGGGRGKGARRWRGRGGKGGRW